ncbi:MAG: tetratricopeptide repeat protein [Candidatus Latescibacteria bacterium]|nr:tetratricopeptide repeat protein [Candidatus Latescibacterota bacterium]
MLKRSRPRLQALAISAVFLMAAGCASHERPSVTPAEGQTSQAPPSQPAGTKPLSRQEEARRQIEVGTAFLERGQYDEAEHAFRLALEAEPGSLQALAGLGRVQVQRGQYSEALPLLERATRVSSQMASAFQALGDAYAATGELERAAGAYRQAVALAPGDLNIRLALARSLTEVGDYEEAEDVCVRSMRIARDDSRALSRVYQQYADVHCRRGKSPEAMSAYYKAVELDPRDSEVNRGLAACALRVGLYAEAVTALTRLLQLAPLDLDAKKQLAWANFKLDRFPVAIGHYEAIRDSLGTVDRYYLGQAYAKANKVDRAVEQFREVIRLDMENYKGVYCNMANAYYDANRYESAINVVREGLRADSTSSCLRYCWAQALDKLGRHEDAIPIFEAVLADPAYAEAAKRELERQKRIVRLLHSK